MQTGIAYLSQAEGFLPVLCQGCSRTPKGSHGVVNLKGQAPTAELTEAQNVACADALAAYLLIWYGRPWPLCLGYLYAAGSSALNAAQAMCVLPACCASCQGLADKCQSVDAAPGAAASGKLLCWSHRGPSRHQLACEHAVCACSERSLRMPALLEQIQHSTLQLLLPRTSATLPQQVHNVTALTPTLYIHQADCGPICSCGHKGFTACVCEE